MIRIPSPRTTQDAKACLELLTLASASQGLLGPSRHPHWPKACQRLGQAFVGLHQHQQVRGHISSVWHAHTHTHTHRWEI